MPLSLRSFRAHTTRTLNLWKLSRMAICATERQPPSARRGARQPCQEQLALLPLDGWVKKRSVTGNKGMGVCSVVNLGSGWQMPEVQGQ